MAIKKQVDKVIRGLGNPAPPLDLQQVYALLKLDPQFYTTTEDGIFRESYSRIRVGIIQVFSRPKLLTEAIKELNLKALYIPDKRRILIDTQLPDLKVRWNSAHEIAHSMCDWHGDVMFGDDTITVGKECHEQIEVEANYGAGRLLFLGDHFTERIIGQQLTIDDLKQLAKLFGNTWLSTLWRVVETLDVPAFAVIGSHPQHEPTTACRYFVRSRLFEQRFSCFDETIVLSLLKTYCTWKRQGPLGKKDVPIIDDNGERHIFLLETFATRWDTMTLGQLL